MSSRWSRRIALGVAASAVGALAALGLAAAPAFAAPPPIDAGTIAVVDDNGAPVSGAIIEVGVASAGPFGPQVYAVTAADGTLDLTSVPGFDPADNPYTVWINGNGYAGYWDGGQDADATVPITIITGGPLLTTSVRANNPPDGTSAGISGTVTDSLTGLPIPGVLVAATDDGNGSENAGASQSATDGTYYLNFSGGTLPSSAAVQFITPLTTPDAPFGYGAQFYDGVSEYSGQVETPVPVSANASVTGIDAAMVPNGLLSGVVTFDGAPLANAQVSAWSTASNSVITTVDTDANGVYSVPTPPGTYRIQFDRLDGNGNIVATLWFFDVATREQGEEVAVESNVETSGVDAEFVTTPVPPPTPTPTPTPALANSGGTDAAVLPLALVGLAAIAAGASVVLVDRRRARARR